MDRFHTIKVIIHIFVKNIMIVKQVYNTDNKAQLLINLPDSFRKKRTVLVVLDDSIDTRTDKIELMKCAKNDPLFQADIEALLF